MIGIPYFRSRDPRRTLKFQSRRNRRGRHLTCDRLEERTLLNAAALDPTFGIGGVVTTDFPMPNTSNQPTREVVDAQGRLIVAGVMFDNQYNTRVVLARYNPDGSLDSSFGSGGLVYTPIDSSPFASRPINSVPAGVAIDSLGRIIVAGTNTAPPVQGPFGTDIGTRNDFAVVRLEPDGTLDTSFGTGGMATIDIGATDPTTGLPIHTDDFVASVAVQTDGKIVVAGTTLDPPPPGSANNDSNFAVARLNPDGSIDTSFGSNGRSIANFPVVNPNGFFGGVSFDTATSLALAPDGKIVVAGITDSDFLGRGDDFAVARFNTDGSLDAGFGSGGLVYEDFGQGNPGSIDDAWAVQVQPDGRIVVGGESGFYYDASREFAVLRLNTDGTNDTSFGTGGLALTTIPGASYSAFNITGLALQPDGKIIAVGWNGTNILARYNPDGSLDSSFGSGGLVDSSTGSALSFSVALQPSDGKILVAGSTFNSTYDTGTLVVERYNPDGSVDTAYGSGGTTTTGFTGPWEGGNPVKPLILPDGHIVVAGTVGLGSPADFALAEYNPDGSLNTDFGTGGLVTTDFGMELNQVSGISLETVNGASKILVAGLVVPANSSYPLPFDLGVARYNLDGTLDTSFGNGGEVALNLGSNVASTAGGIAVEPDGKIVVTASGNNPAFTNIEFAVVRLNTDGSLDAKFGSGGIAITDMSPSSSPGSVDAWTSSVLIQPDGKIVVGGTANYGEFALARYDKDGKLDPSFGSGGKVVLDHSVLPSDIEGIADMALQPDGAIVAVGSVVTSSGGPFGNTDDFAVVRFTKQGTLDSSFGTGGIVTTDLTPSGSTSTTQNDDHATGIVIQPDGKLVVGGWTFNPGSTSDLSGGTPRTLALVRYDSAGALDPTFGSGGISITSIPGTTYTGLAIQPDGKLLLPYTTSTNSWGGTTFGVARFLGVDLNIAAPSSGGSERNLQFTGSFDGQATDDTNRVAWDFGDGTTLTFDSATDPGAMNISHAYDHDGTFTITLTVRFKGGETLTASHQVTVSEEEDQSDRHQPGPDDQVLVEDAPAKLSLASGWASSTPVRLEDVSTLFDNAIATLVSGDGQDPSGLNLSHDSVSMLQSSPLTIGITKRTHRS